MRILLQARSNLWNKPGGDTFQIASLQKGLSELNYKVEIDLSHERNLENFDLVHCFNISRIQETYKQVLNAQLQGKPFVVTPIFQNLSEYNRRGRYGLGGWLASRLSYETTEQIRNAYLWYSNESSKECCKAIWRDGYFTSVRHVLNGSSGLIFNSNSEAYETQHFFKPEKVASSIKIPVGINLDELDNTVNNFSKRYGIKNYILCVGRIEDLKNQIRIIEALRCVPNIPLVFIGFPNPHHKSYIRQFKKAISTRQNTFWFQKLNRSTILSAMYDAKVHVLASFYETTGIANLEASYLGASIVSTEQGYCREIFGNRAMYCNPYDTQSIRHATLQAFNTKPYSDTQYWIKQLFSYNVCALKHVTFYEKMLKQESITVLPRTKESKVF